MACYLLLNPRPRHRRAAQRPSRHTPDLLPGTPYARGRDVTDIGSRTQSLKPCIGPG